jgi:hypothetical protein
MAGGKELRGKTKIGVNYMNSISYILFYIIGGLSLTGVFIFFYVISKQNFFIFSVYIIGVGVFCFFIALIYHLIGIEIPSFWLLIFKVVGWATPISILIIAFKFPPSFKQLFKRQKN